MSGREQSVNPEPATDNSRLRLRKANTHRRVLVVGLLAILVGALLVPTWAGDWAPIVHWSCASSGEVASQVVWIPLILLNAPYGGYVSGNATVVMGVIGNDSGLGYADGTESTNGSVSGLFVHVLANASKNSNDIVWGSGSNARCSHEFTVATSVYFGGPSGEVYSGILGNSGNVSDSQEPHAYNFSANSGDSTAYFDNGFSRANVESVSTCDTGGNWVAVDSTGLSMWLSLPIDGKITAVNYLLPFPQAFHYYFPPNFGSWQIDNLSAPGGPGGGWAFSYSPC
jgi:hypothetical protein